jgi:branched-chain amino acid transport system permease protein
VGEALLIAQLSINALALGAAYALVALGFVLIINATSAVNFAQGDLVMAGGFVSVSLAALVQLPGVVLLPLVLVVMASLGLLFSLLAYFPLKKRPPVAVFISTIALGIVLQNGANGLYGGAPRAGPPLFGAGRMELGGLALDRQSLAILGTAALITGGLHFLLTRTQLGRRMRAVAEDQEMARAVGIPVNRMIALTFALAAALAGAAGLLLANQFFVTPTEGTNLMIKAYIATVIGGWGRLHGAIAGAMLIAVFEVGVAAWISYPVAEALLYAALLAVLFLRPQGLFGEAAGHRA